MTIRSTHDPNLNIDNILNSYFDNRIALFQEVTQSQQEPSPFALHTSAALAMAAEVAIKQDKGNPLFKAVVAPTGGGKTVSTLGLMVHALRSSSGFSGAMVVHTIEEAHELYLSLKQLLAKDGLEGDLAIFTSAHRADAKASVIQEIWLDKDIKIEEQFTEEQFRTARMVVCTHHRWKDDIEKEADRGVLKWTSPNGTKIDRTLIVVDEDPDMTKTFVRQPGDIARLGDILSGAITTNEGRAFEFVDVHPLIPALRSIHARMQDMKDVERGKKLETGFTFTDEEKEAVLGLTKQDIQDRLNGVDAVALADAWETIQFLQTAITGRFFYNRQKVGSEFHAYGTAMPGQHRTIILDGTADLNALYLLAENTTLMTSKRPDYSKVRVIHVTPPPAYQGKTGTDHILKRRSNAQAYMAWVKELVVGNTTEGEEVLVYAKKALLGFEAHKELEDAPSLGLNTAVNWSGRKVHFVHFGVGRGSNKWRHCTAYFRLGDFHLPKAALISKIGSVTDTVYTQERLDHISCGTTTDADYVATRDSHLLITNKQDAARVCIRSFNSEGTANPARLYLVDVKRDLLVANLQRLFPGCPEIGWIGDEEAESKMTGPQKLGKVLSETDKTILEAKEITELTGIRSVDIARSLGSAGVKPIVAARGWRKATRKEAGLPGKGVVLLRDAA